MTLIQRFWLYIWLNQKALPNHPTTKELLSEFEALEHIQNALKQCEQQLNQIWHSQMTKQADVQTSFNEEEYAILADNGIVSCSGCDGLKQINAQSISLLDHDGDAGLSHAELNVLNSINGNDEQDREELELATTQIRCVPAIEATIQQQIMDQAVEVSVKCSASIEDAQSVTVIENEQIDLQVDTGGDAVQESSVPFIIDAMEQIVQSHLDSGADAEISQLANPSLILAGGSHTMPLIDPQKSLAPVPSKHYYRITLPNSREGEPYVAALILEPAINSVISKVEFEPECGLFWQIDNGQCMGIPNMSGNVNVKVWWHLAEGDNPQHELVQTTLYVNADPKSLWRNIPSNSNSHFWKCDDAMGSIAGEYDIVAARVRGRSHAHIGSCCDDDFGIEKIDGLVPAYIAVVSDGAGSAAYSRFGSKLAVDAAQKVLSSSLQSEASLQFVQKQIDTDADEASWQDYVQTLLSRAAYQAYTAQYEAAKLHADVIQDVKQLACTLIIGMSLKLPNKKWLIGAYWVGDGAIAIYNSEEGSVNILGESDSGEFSGQTCFLSKEEVELERLYSRIVYRIVEGDHALILMTDGVSDPKFDSEQALHQIHPWNGLWQEWISLGEKAQDAQEMAQLLQQWLGFWSQGNHDDRTLVIVSPHLYSCAETNGGKVNS